MLKKHVQYRALIINRKINKIKKCFKFNSVIAISQFFLSGNAIEDLLVFYRDAFPEESITPKLHLLEDHVLPFVSRWGASFGTYGEQGMEGLHATMNNLKMSFSSIPNSKDRLTAIMKEHYMRVNLKGKAISQNFEPKRRK